MSDFDSRLANYRVHPTTVYCANRECGNSDGVTVTFFSEYGQNWIEPEECPSCGGKLLDDPPKEDDEDDEEE